ncbi:MAG: hypothetical protein Q7U60_00735 [Candidatus Methanoperedens sp.]|nr:hypothetical protein [Candidatus Methanoperedens sp.]
MKATSDAVRNKVSPEKVTVRFKRQVKVIPKITMENIKKEKSSQDTVTIFREAAKGRGKLRFHPHEAYEEEMEERINP